MARGRVSSFFAPNAPSTRKRGERRRTRARFPLPRLPARVPVPIPEFGLESVILLRVAARRPTFAAFARAEEDGRVVRENSRVCPPTKFQCCA